MLGKLPKQFKISTAHFAISLILIQYCFSAPVENIYSKFINDLNRNECATPEQIKLPANSSAAENVELLSSSLMICQNLDTVARIKEAQYLCREIFDNLKVVLCPNSMGIIKPLNITFSKQVCKDIASLKNVSENTFLLKHLTDNWSCDMLCDAAFEKACQLLHWSYQVKRDFEENENTKNKVIAGNPKQESLLGSDQPKSQEPKQTKENGQKNAEFTQGQTKGAVLQPTNTFVLRTQKNNSLLEHAQNQAENVQPNINSNVNPPAPVISKDAATNSILSKLQDNEGKNMSDIVALKAPQDFANKNDLPENDNVGLPDNEDPHDNEGIYTNVEPVLSSNKEPPQPPNNILPSVSANIQLSNTPANIGVSNLSANNELLPLPADNLPTANGELPQRNLNADPVDPHDGEELGEEESPSTNPKAPEQETTVSLSHAIKNEVTSKNEDKVQTQAKQAATQNRSSTTKTASSSGSSSTTKAASSVGSTKSSTATAEKKVVEVKSSSVEVSSATADGQKTTESLSSLPSLKDTSSSVVSPINEDLSPALVNIEKMDGEEDAHEMPEDREPDEYTDLEKTEGEPDGDYARQEYDGIYEPAKNKEKKPEKANEVEVSKVDVGSQKEQTFDEFSPRSKYGPDDVPLIPVVFPEQEDGHFFFYFLSMVLILMAGYLIFHNKQKIIALIVEGRHERRRRSHGAGYKKLETK